MVHVWSFLFFSFGGGRESRGQGQGIAWLPSWMKTLCPCCPRVPVAAVGVTVMVIAIMWADIGRGAHTLAALWTGVSLHRVTQRECSFFSQKMYSLVRILRKSSKKTDVVWGHITAGFALSQCRPNLGSLKIPAVVLGRVLALRSPPGWCYLPIPPSPLNSQLRQWAYLPKINSKSLEDSFTKLGSRSVLGFFQSFTFFLSLLDAHFKVSVCLNQRSHMWLHLYI